MSATHSAVVKLPVGADGMIVGDYVPAAGDFAVVWVHGFGSHRGGEKAAEVRAACAARGWPFAAFDFRGHGDSPGSMLDLRASRLLEDLAAVRDLLADRGRTRLGLVGSSMGGFAAAWFTRRHPADVVGCVFLAPAFGFLERRWNSITDAERADWVRTGRRRVKSEWVDVDVGYGLVEERADFTPEKLTAGWATPALLFHGCADDVVPDTDSLNFLRAVAFPDVELRLLKDGDHRLTAHKTTIADAAGSFFERLS
ncbi:alpha/beta hydrolase [Fimbriiglobus ruber]|uniref:2-hydroxymuconic semialdehyde hydrolase n=1 Tax=Fimbriiglobus ruber TaxID=1908690 RepID=A0A225DAS5_9BACT|nr:alpha/beta fold hydrolase [Fimbriiglobus ruber]OWK38073.1 2-hydroxymuconic semialdehyde hydrolase [Fimbriiglobus ruber]